MFIKPTRSGGHTYLQLVESFRNDAGQPRQRTVATLGRLDEVGGGVDSLLAGLLRAKGLPAWRPTIILSAVLPHQGMLLARLLSLCVHSLNFQCSEAVGMWSKAAAVGNATA